MEESKKGRFGKFGGQYIPETLMNEIKKLENKGEAAIVITSPIVRMYFKRMTSDFFSDLIVISYNEIDSNVELKSLGVITVSD